MYRLLHISSVKSFREDQNHLLRHITYHTKGQMKHYWKHLFTYWIQTDIKSAGNCRKRTYLENIQSVRKVALLLFEGVCSCRTLKQPVAVITDGTLKHLQYFTWDSALLREGIAWSST